MTETDIIQNTVLVKVDTIGETHRSFAAAHQAMANVTTDKNSSIKDAMSVLDMTFNTVIFMDQNKTCLSETDQECLRDICVLFIQKDFGVKTKVLREYMIPKIKMIAQSPVYQKYWQNGMKEYTCEECFVNATFELVYQFFVQNPRKGVSPLRSAPIFINRVLEAA